MKKRFLSLLLVLAVAISVIVITVVATSAEATDGYAATDATLAENITLQVKFKLPTCSTATVKIGDKEAYKVTDFTVEPLTDESGNIMKDENGNVIEVVSVPVRLAVKDLSKPIVVTVTDGLTTYEKSTLENSDDPFTANAYFAALSNDPNYEDIINALLAYSESARIYFNGGTVNYTKGEEAFKDYQTTNGVSEGTQGAVNISKHEASLILESETIIRHYFTFEEGIDPTAYTFKVDGKKLTPNLASGNNRYYVDIEGITPKELDKAYTVSVSNGENTYSYKYSALDYAYRKANTDTTASDALKALSEKLYYYSQEAEALPNLIIYETQGFGIADEVGTYTTSFTKDTEIILPDNINGLTSKDAIASGDVKIFGGWYFDPAFKDKATPENIAEKTEYVKLYAKITIESYQFVKDGQGSPKYKDDGNPSIHGDAIAGSDGYFTYSIEIPAGLALSSAKFWIRSFYSVATDQELSIYFLRVENNAFYAGKGENYKSGNGEKLADYTGEALTIDVVTQHKLSVDGKLTGEVIFRYYIDGEICKNEAGNIISYEKMSEKLFGVPATDCNFSESTVRQYNAQAFSINADNTTGTFVGQYNISLYAGNIYPENPDDDFESIVLKAKVDSFDVNRYTDINEKEVFANGYPDPQDPISEHPRIWVNPQTLPTVKSNLLVGENKNVYLGILNSAKTALTLDGKLASVKITNPTGEEVNAITSGYEICEGNYSITALQRIENLAFMYLVTGEEKYGYAAMLHAMNHMDTYTLSAPYKHTDDPKLTEEQNKAKKQTAADNAYANHFHSGTAIYIMAEVYDWCYDLFTPEQRNMFVEGVCEVYAHNLEMGYPPEGQGGIVGHGTGLQFLRNWLAFAIAIEDEYPEIYDFIVGRINDEFLEAPEIYYQSTIHFQGSSYGPGKVHTSAIAQILFERATGTSLFKGVDFGEVTRSFIHRFRPDDTPFRVGDDPKCGGDAYSMDIYLALTFITATYYDDPLSKAWYKEWSNNYDPSTMYNTELDITPAIFMMINDPKVEAQDDKYDGLELAYYTKYPSTSLVARSAWHDPDAWVTFTNIEETYLGNHDHKDAGTFQIYYKGILAPDAGVYQYNGQAYGAAIDRAYTKQTVSKNGLLIYNPAMNKHPGTVWGYSGGQTLETMNDNGDFDYDTVEDWKSDPTFHQSKILGQSSLVNGDSFVYAYLAGDITEAYDEETVDLVTRSTMTLATGNTANPMAFIVYDRIISDSESFEKSFVLHTTNKPVFGNDTTLVGTEITTASTTSKNWYGFNKVTGTNTFYYDNTMGPSGAGNNSSAEYNGQLTVQTLLPENPTYYYVGGDGKRFWVNGANAGSETEDPTKYPVAERGWGRVEIAPTKEQTDDSFLNVMYVSDAGTMVSEQAQLITSTDSTHEGVVTFGNCVMFAKQTTAVSYANYDGTEATAEQRAAAVQDTLISSTVSFDTTGTTGKATGTMTYYVTGLKAGMWTVTVGTETKEVEVTVDGAIAVFEAPVGNVTLDYKGAKTSEIKYEKNGGEFVDGYIAPGAVEYEKSVALPTADKIAKEGYTFDGWYDNADCTGTAIDSVTYKDGGVTVYAKWTPKSASITYNTDGGTINGDYKNTVTYGTTTTLPTDVTKDGYTFDGWYSDEALTNKVTSVEYKDNGVTVYAKWTLLPARITYVTNGGKFFGDEPTTEIKEDAEIDLTAIGIEHETYIFDGWYLTEDFSGEAVKELAYDMRNEENEITLYAKWVEAPALDVGGEGGGIVLPEITV